MDKEKRIQEYENKQLIDELSKMPPTVIATAYLHAINYTLYGEDVTEKWITATQNVSALEKAYRKGYYDALHRQTESEEMTNKEILCKLNTGLFECAIHALYFSPALWNENKYSTPNPIDTCKWLDSEYNQESEFWKFIKKCSKED